MLQVNLFYFLDLYLKQLSGRVMKIALAHHGILASLASTKGTSDYYGNGFYSSSKDTSNAIL